MGPLDGRVALVTGGSRGIGRSIVLDLARAGARVAINYRSTEAQAREVANEIIALRSGSAQIHRDGEARAVEQVGGSGGAVIAAAVQAEDDATMLAQADVSNPQEARDLVRRVVDKWGRLDILVNNAGITKDRTLKKMTDEDWVAVINNNLNGVYYCTSAAMPVMIEQNYGRIIMVGSLIAQAGNIGQANYGSAKGGVIAFVKCAALELAKYDITVNVVHPGFTATEMLLRVPETIQDQIKAKIPKGRFATPEEIARAVQFLATDTGYITGQQINVNGGLYM